jgi:hypothetical protein
VELGDIEVHVLRHSEVKAVAVLPVDEFRLDIPPETFFGLQTLHDIAHRLHALQEASGRPYDLQPDQE